MAWCSQRYVAIRGISCANDQISLRCTSAIYVKLVQLGKFSESDLDQLCE